MRNLFSQIRDEAEAAQEPGPVCKLVKIWIVRDIDLKGQSCEENV
jgi:hypothetical protein